MRIDTRAMTPEQTIAMAHAYLGSEFRSSPLPGDPPRIGGAGNLWVLGNMSAAVDFDISARLQRRCERSLAATVRCRVITAGRVDGVVEGEVVRLRPGDVVIEASNISFSLDLDDFGCDVVGISVADIGHERVSDLTYSIIPRGTPEAVLIAASMRTFFKQLSTCESNSKIISIILTDFCIFQISTKYLHLLFNYFRLFLIETLILRSVQ